MSDIDLMQLAGFDFGKRDSSPLPSGVNGGCDFDSSASVIIPDIKPVKNQKGKPVIVVIDDDFSTLDLMKIYLQRDYEYSGFDSSRDAIFFLNKNVPSIIFLDSYINIIGSKRIIEIIRSYKELADVPIILLGEPEEKSSIMAKKIEGVSGFLARPVARGELQEILDKHLT